MKINQFLNFPYKCITGVQSESESHNFSSKIVISDI